MPIQIEPPNRNSHLGIFTDFATRYWPGLERKEKVRTTGVKLTPERLEQFKPSSELAKVQSAVGRVRVSEGHKTVRGKSGKFQIGSAYAISPQYLVTCAHVVNTLLPQGDKLWVDFPMVNSTQMPSLETSELISVANDNNNGEEDENISVISVPVTVEEIDPKNDFALLKAVYLSSTYSIPFVKVSDTLPASKEIVVAIGHRADKVHRGGKKYNYISASKTTGYRGSGFEKREPTKIEIPGITLLVGGSIDTNVELTPGQSGGLLCNADGEAVGILKGIIFGDSPVIIAVTKNPQS